MTPVRRKYVQERIATWDEHVARWARNVALRPCNRATKVHATCVAMARQWRERMVLEEAGAEPANPPEVG